MIRRIAAFHFLFILGLGSQFCSAESNAEIRLGVLVFGTLNWELNTITKEGLGKQQGFELQLHPVASPQAAKIALQAKAVDIIVTDWIWVSRQRAEGTDFSFAPYSTTAGALMVPAKSNITGIEHLAHKRLGIAGGALDKNWLLLRALAEKTARINLDRSVDKVFGAPPLLNQQMLQNKLDALINYWHYAARLEARGYRKLLDGREILRGLGIRPVVPTLGYVFREAWATKNRSAVIGFLSASRRAKDLLCESNTHWNNILELTRTNDPSVQRMLRQRYCEGRIERWGEQERKAAEQLYALLYDKGGESLTGKSRQLQPGTFWPYEITQQ